MCVALWSEEYLNNWGLFFLQKVFKLKKFENWHIRIGDLSLFKINTRNSLEKSPFWEANRFSATQEIPHILWNPSSLPRLQKPTTCPYHEQSRSSACTHSTSLKSLLILFFHLRLYLPSDLLTVRFPHWNSVCTSILFCDNQMEGISQHWAPPEDVLLLGRNA